MRTAKYPQSWLLISIAFVACVVLFCIVSLGLAKSTDGPPKPAKEEWYAGQPQSLADQASKGCKTCHHPRRGTVPEVTQTAGGNCGSMDNCSTAQDVIDTMHPSKTVVLGCTNCHGGDSKVELTQGIDRGTPEYCELQEKAHDHLEPCGPLAVPGTSSANPKRDYAKWMKKSPELIRFINPGDLRIADMTCGNSGCHTEEVKRVKSSMMTHGAMLWAAALYNNGSFPLKDAHFGQSYSKEGVPQRLVAPVKPSITDMQAKGILPYLEPLERWEVSQPGNVLRVFERGGGQREEVGNPQDEDQPGRPDAKLSDRGFGTLLRTDPVFLGLQKTRLFDPMLSFPGTNDHPGDFRQSGCTACHVIYANDRDPEHSSFYSALGNGGHGFQDDETLLDPKSDQIRNDPPGHPIQHVLTKIIPSSQCMVCHVHPGTNMVASYFGDTWWDNEVDGDKMYPKDQNGRLIQKNPSEQEYHDAREKNPEGSAAKGLWSGDKFLQGVGSAGFNSKLKDTQFADFHSHGWVFRKVYKQDRYGNLLDERDNPIEFEDKHKFDKAVHLKDIHLENGMHCTDCHFNQDVHGNGNLYGETRNAIEISCTDCHGTISSYASLTTSGPAAPTGGTKMQAMTTPWKEDRFFWEDGRLYQRSSIRQGKTWEVVQVKDVVTRGRPHFSEKGSLAMTLQKGGETWGVAADDPAKLAHSDKRMTCVSCHSSWTTTCFGCHLPMTANQRMPMLQNEGTMTRNWTEYDFQVLRNDMYMLGIDGTVTGNRVAPIRSACAVVVSSQNQNRDWIYYGQQTISAEGFSGTAFSPYLPHAVRKKETRGCTDCHVSKDNDNNAWMAQLLLQGTNFLNYLGRYAYVANGNKGFSAIAFAELKEPEAVIGSDFHKLAYPDNYERHQKKKQELKEAYEHPGKEVLDVQLRGEYLYAAMGKGGLRIYDVANIENKDFSERMITAPVSRLGQKFFVHTKNAQAVAAPSTTAIDPTRKHFPENEEQGLIPAMYGYLYVADKAEGLVVIGDSSDKSKTPGVSTLLDGEPRNNFLKRAILKDKEGRDLGSFNPPENPNDPHGKLDGARRIIIAGEYAYILSDNGLFVVSLHDPLCPEIVAEIRSPELKHPRGIGIQFRYAFVVDDEGLKVLDVTDLAKPRLLPNVNVKINDAKNITVSRTYAYISAGSEGMAIVNIEKPEHPWLKQMFNASNELKDTRDIKIGMVSSSQFALVADGKYGFKVIQLFSPDNSSLGFSPGFYGFAPEPHPMLVAKFKTRGSALAVSRGVDRDRAVDESGNQLSVFGRRGSRPFNMEEMQRMFLCSEEMHKRSLCGWGELYTVTDDIRNPVQHIPRAAAAGASGVH